MDDTAERIKAVLRGTRGRPRKNLNGKLSPYQVEKLKELYAEQKAKLARLDEIEAKVKKENPFWFYEPVDGKLDEARLSFLREFLNPEDIPQKLDSALDVHLSESPIRGASGGNQSGKTTTCCIEAIIKCTGALPYVFDPSQPRYFKYEYPAKRLKRSGPQFVRVIGEDYQNGILRNLLPTYRKWFPKEYLKDGSWEKSYSAEAQTLSAYHPDTKELLGTIEFMSNKQDLGTFQGPPRHMVIYDEEPDPEVRKENLLRFTTADSLDELYGMTPTKGMSWTYDLFTRGTDESGNKIEWFQIASVCNRHANLNVLREILSEMASYDEVKMRLLGEFVSLSGLVYGKLFNRRIHVIPPFETGCTCGGQQNHDPGCPFLKFVAFMGVDPHTVKDSDAVLCVLDREDNFIVDTCYEKPVSTDEFKQDLKKLISGKRFQKAWFDPSSDSSLTIYEGKNIFYDMTHGQNAIRPASKAEKYAGSIAAGIDTFKRRLKVNERTGKPTFFIMDRPENQKLIKSMMTLQRETFTNEHIKGKRDKVAEGTHDHHAAVRYILQNKLFWRPYQPQVPVSPIPDHEAVLH